MSEEIATDAMLQYRDQARWSRAVERENEMKVRLQAYANEWTV